jgi:nitric oxide reductase subunit B
LGAVLGVSFAVLGSAGFEIQASAPPIPPQVVTTDGRVGLEHDTIQHGQGVWQSLGGQQIGSVWGHGAYLAPDWTADWLHREAMFILAHWARNISAVHFAALSVEPQEGLRARLEDAFSKYQGGCMAPERPHSVTEPSMDAPLLTFDLPALLAQLKRENT